MGTLLVAGGAAEVNPWLRLRIHLPTAMDRRSVYRPPGESSTAETGPPGSPATAVDLVLISRSGTRALFSPSPAMSGERSG